MSATKQKGDALGDFLSSVVEYQQEPPRTVRTADAIRAVLSQQMSKLIIGFSVFLIAAIVFMYFGPDYAWGPGDKAATKAGILLVAVGLLALFVWRLVVGVRDLLDTLVNGVLVEAEVISGGFAPAGYDPNRTPDAIEYGEARGKLEVSIGDEVRELDFRIDRPWASQIRPGTYIRALAIMRRRIKLTYIGIAER